MDLLVLAPRRSYNAYSNADRCAVGNSHPNTCAKDPAVDYVVLSAGEVDALPYFIMPYIEGESLRGRIMRGPLSLRELAAELGIDEAVEFRGFVSEEEKIELFRRAWAHVLTSPKEGWGITVVEAAACGTCRVAVLNRMLTSLARDPHNHGIVAASRPLAGFIAALDRYDLVGRRACDRDEASRFEHVAAFAHAHLGRHP